MKKAVLFALAALLVSAVAEARLDKGMQELGVQGMLDLDAEDKYDLDLNLTYGYFFRHNTEVGLVTDFQASDSVFNAKFGGFIEHNFNNDISRWVPYIGLAAQLGSMDIDFDENDANASLNDSQSALNLVASLGLKYFINDNVALTGTVTYNWATDKLYPSEDELKDTATKIFIGTRFYF